MVPRGRKTKHAQRPREREAALGDCGQDLRLGCAVWNARPVQPHSCEAEQHEEKPRNRAHLVALGAGG